MCMVKHSHFTFLSEGKSTCSCKVYWCPIITNALVSSKFCISFWNIAQTSFEMLHSCLEVKIHSASSMINFVPL